MQDKNIIKIYPNISKTSKVSTIYTKYQVAPSPAQARGRGPGPACVRPRAWAGLRLGRRPLGILYLSWISSISWIYLGNIFRILFWDIFGIFEKDARDPQNARVFPLDGAPLYSKSFDPWHSGRAGLICMF